MNHARNYPIRAVLFDLDDTLWPIVPVIVRAETLLFDWLSEHAPKVSARYTIASLRSHRSQLMKDQPALAFDLTALRLNSLCEIFDLCGEDKSKLNQAMTLFSHARNQVTPYEDVLECLPKLSSKLILGSLTNGGADLQAIGMAHHFQVSLAAHQLGCAKPDPKIFNAACEALQLPPEQVAYVGDDLRLDVEGAQKAGLTGIWLNREQKPINEDCAHIRPDAILRTLHELDDWLTTNTAQA
jgi:putative hydrolase of the HAD superfamily